MIPVSLSVQLKEKKTGTISIQEGATYHTNTSSCEFESTRPGSKDARYIMYLKLGSIFPLAIQYPGGR